MANSMMFQPRQIVRPPEKGSFPLDHDGECKEFMLKYMTCLQLNKRENIKCRHQSKDYLNCRMQRNLMMKEDWKNLGYNDLVNGESNTINGASKDDPP